MMDDLSRLKCGKRKELQKRQHGEENKEVVSSPKPEGNVQTVVYHDPMSGLNEFGMKINRNPPKATLIQSVPSDDESDASTPALSKSIPDGNGRNRGRNPPNTTNSPSSLRSNQPSPTSRKVKSPPNEVWKVGGVKSSVKSPGGDGGTKPSVTPNAKTKSPTKQPPPPWNISSINTKHRDNSWDSDK